MKIRTLELTDYKGVNYLSIKESPNTVVLIGPNGSGKSTVLHALNMMLQYCLGYRNRPKGVRLVLDLSDHCESIKNWLNRELYNIIMNKMVGNNQKRGKRTLNFFEKHVLTQFFNRPLIEYCNQSDIKLIGDYGEPDDDPIKTHLQQTAPTKQVSYWYGFIIHQWLQTRSSGNSEAPGVVVFDTRKVI